MAIMRPFVVAILVAVAPPLALLSCGSNGGSPAADAGGDGDDSSQGDATMDGSEEPESGEDSDATMTDAHADADASGNPDATEGGSPVDASSERTADAAAETSMVDAGEEGDGFVFEPPDTGPYPEAGCPMDAGSPTALATGEVGPSVIATDGAVAFWLDAIDSTTSLLRSCAVAGCNGVPFTLTIAGPVAYDAQMVVDDKNVYWTDRSAHVWSCPKTGCSAPSAVVSTGSTIIGVGSDGSNLFWTDGDLQLVSTCTLPACATSTVLASNLSLPNRLSIDSTTVFWAQHPMYTTGSVWSCAKTGCANTPTAIGSAQFTYDPMQLSVNATDAYWVTWVSTDGYIKTCPKGGCAGGPNNAANVVHLSFTEPYALAADDTDTVYWSADTEILSCPKVGCTNQGTPVAVGQSGARSLTIDRRTGCQSTLFWTNGTGGSVMALPL